MTTKSRPMACECGRQPVYREPHVGRHSIECLYCNIAMYHNSRDEVHGFWDGIQLQRRKQKNADVFPIHPGNCNCGAKPLQTRQFTGSSWQCRISCFVCGISTGQGDYMPLAVKQWNRIQDALYAQEHKQ